MCLEERGHLLQLAQSSAVPMAGPRYQAAFALDGGAVSKPLLSNHYFSLWLLDSRAVMSFETCLQLLTRPVTVAGLTVIGVILTQAFVANDNESQYVGILCNHLNYGLYWVVI